MASTRPQLRTLEERTTVPVQHVLPAMVLMLAALFLAISLFLPYWEMRLFAPQYPDGLAAQVYVNQVRGDVREIDTLNHYIGMRPFAEAARVERAIALPVLTLVLVLLVAATFLPSRWAARVLAPVVIFPLFFLGDLFYWLYSFGQNLDPRAPLSSAIHPFIPTLLGTGMVGQFRTEASLSSGFFLAITAALAALAGLVLHRRFYGEAGPRLRLPRRGR